MDKYIRKDKIIQDIEEEIGISNMALDEDVWFNRGLKTALSYIKKFPAADVQPVKHGKWIDIHEWCKMHNSKPSGIGFYYWCSNCGKCVNHRTNYCGECGAKMDGNKEKDNNVGHLTDEETAIYESWIESEAEDTGENIMDGDVE